MTTIIAPICTVCKHWFQPDGHGFKCAAFPNGIPEPIIEGVADHRKPYHGDKGIRFEQDPNKSDAAIKLFDEMKDDESSPVALSNVTPKRPVRRR